MDYLYLVADTYLRTGRLIHSIVDRTLLLVLTSLFFSKNSLAQVPGLGSVAYLMTCSAPSREETTALLDAGNIVGVAPGGGRQVANKRTNKQTNNIVGVAPLDYVPKLAHETAMPGRESGREYFFV